MFSCKSFILRKLLLATKVDFSQSPLLLVKVVLRRTMGVVGWSGGRGGHAVTHIELGKDVCQRGGDVRVNGVFDVSSTYT